MTKRKKKFDCLKVVEESRARLAKEYEGLTAEERDARHTEWLAHSQDPLARVWRGERVLPESELFHPGDAFFKPTFPTDDFSAVEMKNDLQANLRDRYEGMSDQEIMDHRQNWLSTSDDVLARWWRGEFDEENLRKQRLATAAREDAGPYKGSEQT